MSGKSILSILLVGGLLTVAGVALAGGNTIASSAQSQTLKVNNSITLASGLSDLDANGTDVCATIVNQSASNTVIVLTVTDVVAVTTTMQIAKAKSSALCGEDTEAVSVMCLGPTKCAFTWSIDKF